MRHPWRGLAGLPRELWILAAATFVNRAGTMALPFLALYLTRERGLSAASASVALFTYGLGALLTGPLSGRLSDRLGPRPVLLGSLVLGGVLMMALPLADSDAVRLPIVFLWAFTAEAFRPASMAIVGSLAPPGRTRAAFALHRFSVNLGFSIGPLTGGLLAAVSFPALFVVDGLSALAAAGVIAMFFPASTPAAEAGSGTAAAAPGRARRGVLSGLGDRHLVAFLLALFPVLICFFQLGGALPLWMARDLGLSEARIGAFFTLNTALIILFEVPLTGLMEKASHGRVLALGAALTGAGFGGLAWVHDLTGLAAMFVVWTVGEMILLPASNAYAAELAPPGRRGEYAGLYTLTFSLAFSIGPALGVLVLDRFGGPTTWSAAFGCALLAALLMLRLRPARAG